MADTQRTIAGLKIPVKKPRVRLLRRSKPFWGILGEHHIFSSVIRVPITFPPDRFGGRIHFTNASDGGGLTEIILPLTAVLTQ